jgi:hypothetical protein
VPGHINKPKPEIANRKIGEPDVYRNASLFFLFETIRVDSGESFY